VESFILPTDAAVNRANEGLIAEYWQSGFGGIVEPTGKGWTVRDVPVETIEDFLAKFRAHPDFAERKSAASAYLQALAEEHPACDVLLISVEKNGEDAAQFRLGTQDRKSATRKNDAWYTSKDRVASRGDEKLGLTDAQQAEAAAIAAQDDAKRPSDLHYRSVRQKPLLMLHVLGPVGSENSQDRVPAFGVSFPPGHYETEIEVVANTVWVDRMRGIFSDSPDEEEDYDE
jgi:hypothetical protein